MNESTSTSIIPFESPKVEGVKPIVIRLRRVAGSNVILHVSEYRFDINGLLQQIPGRLYNGKTNENAIPIGTLDDFLRRAKNLPSVTILSNEGIAKAVHDALFSAPFSVSIKNSIIIKLDKNSSPNYFYDIPGFNWNHAKRTVELPLGEGWRLWKVIEQHDLKDDFVFEDDASALITSQVENRLQLDNIALAEDVPDFPEIPGLKGVNPRPFQKVGVKFFTLNGGSGLLCDEMGLGKTLQAIMLAMLKGWRTLIVCPASLKVNWIREIAKFTDETVYELQGEVPNMWDISHIIANKPRFVIINYDIIGRGVKVDNSRINEYGYKVKDIQTKLPWIEVLNICNFDLCVYDEAHYIKNKDSQRSVAARQLKAKNVIGLTGTPILNRPGEFWPILHIIKPEIFPSHDTFVRQYTWDGKRPKNTKELHELLKPMMIRRRKKDVMKDLPAVNRIENYHELTPKGRKLYEKVLQGVYRVLAEWDPKRAGAEKEVTNILVQIMRLKQVVAIDMIPTTADLATEIYDSTGKKCLIFSHFKPMCFGINHKLGTESLGFVTRSANGEFKTLDDTERQRMIDRFQNEEDIHFLCVTENTAKEGYNITKADVVIFHDLFWTPAAHDQAEGRAYGRMSDPHPIDAYYRIGVDTISEWNMELLAGKIGMIEETVEGVQRSRGSADESVVMELITRMKEGMWTRKSR